MKRIALVIMMLVSTLASHLDAKTIHWLTFIDTTTPNISETDQNSRKLLYSHLIDVVNATLNEQGYNINVVDVYGSKTNPQSCTDIINDLDCGSEDIVMFYYIGHGTENTGTSAFPLMMMAQSDPRMAIPFEWVHKELQKKGARLTISISMCCNSRQGAPGKVSPSFSANYGNTYVDTNTAESIKKLFLNFKGDLAVASASPAESSWECNSSLGPTDFFTYNLIDQFTTCLPEKESPNWLDFFENVKVEVSKGVKDCKNIQMRYPGTTQTPFWSSIQALSNANRLAQTAPTTPPTPKQNTDDRTSIKTQLYRVFAYLSSTKVNPDQRIALAKKLKSAFSSELVVRIMSQDGNIVVDKEPISKFLGRISTDTGLLMNVSVVDFSIDQNGIINSLRVHEIIRKSKK